MHLFSGYTISTLRVMRVNMDDPAAATPSIFHHSLVDDLLDELTNSLHKPKALDYARIGNRFSNFASRLPGSH